MAKILIMDDDAHIRRFAQVHLKADGHEVVSAEDGAEGLAMVEWERPDLILLDVVMPKMDGYEVLRQLRGEEPFRGIPVIMFTTEIGTREVARGLDAGAEDYITKPFDPEEFLARVRSCLRMKELERELVEKERKLAGVETLRQTLVTLSHHINNAMTGICGNAELCRAGDVSTDRLVAVCLAETERISAVLGALDRMVKEMDIRTTDYAGFKDMMFDIEEELKRRLGGSTDQVK